MALCIGASACGGPTSWLDGMIGGGAGVGIGTGAEEIEGDDGR